MSLMHHLDRHEADASGHKADRPSPLVTAERAPAKEDGWQPSTRYSDQPMDWRTRLFGMGGVGTVALLIAAGALFTWTTYTAAPAPSALSVFDVTPPASPPETPPEEKQAPKPVEKKEAQPEPQETRPIEPTKIQISPVTVPVPVTLPRSADPGPVEPETAAPKTLPAPAAPQVSSNAADTWEGRVLAALHKQRRYPRNAMIRRQQGVPYIRFTMDRDGKVLASQLESSSGFPELDREAVSLARRASPLPKPPKDRTGDILELVVPVEFFLR
ncbi:MAG: energy transducer TonB [Sphingobium sp.]